MSFIAQLGLQTAGQAVGYGMGILREKHNDKRQIEQQERLQQMQITGQKQMTDYNYAKQMQMWKDTNYSAQKDELKKAGLNPGLLYGMTGGGGATTGSGGGSVQGATAQQNPGETKESMEMGMSMAQMAAQTALILAQKTKTETEVPKVEAETKNTEADTQNKILNSVIQDYTGKDMKLTYNRIKAPNIAVESEANLKELEARQGVAGTIYELWHEGKLAEKSLAEIEGILLQNAKTRAEKSEIMLKMDMLEQNIKGAKLDNIIKDLETRLQTETGIDRNSPAWMKIIGRLLVQLFNK